jgi:filamentous hemagglutinin
VKAHVPPTNSTNPVQLNPERLVQTRVDELWAQIPENSRGRITMGVGVLEDSQGVRMVVVSTSEPRGYLRPGVTLKEGEIVIPGSTHAETDIIAYAKANGLRVVEIGATRPVCLDCQNQIAPTGAHIATPIKPPRNGPE